jgi:hypothetical protein
MAAKLRLPYLFRDANLIVALVITSLLVSISVDWVIIASDHVAA